MDAPATRRRGWKELTGVSDWNPESPLLCPKMQSNWEFFKPALRKISAYKAAEQREGEYGSH
jgi:hypothetical protein